ncbi:HET-domain-containing protein [Apiospora kogelbergensis]|uniref:HET-domain-containing protein n=1 Tax=Apiospora kogelbergensis TaxID=1337665 RepID=A0AAW0R3E7_9PEZI
MAQKYAALSYCWGLQLPHLKAEASTLSKLREGVSWYDLPKTLSDAVALAAKIGCRWIWIDSMCIVQDDKQDWATEAAKMSTVYQHALVTVIANSASCCNEGFIDKPRKPSVRLGEVSSTEQGKSVEVYGRVLYDWGYHRGGPQSHMIQYTKWRDPVDYRGWTLQESVLSTRYLCFTSGEVQFRCQERKACECGQHLYGRLHNTTDPKELWFETVEEYARRRLTRQSDITVAFKGIQHMTAAKIREENMTCVSMIWLQPKLTSFSASSLLWFRNSREDPAYFPKGLPCPSYSWTSVNGSFIHSIPRQLQNLKFPTRCLGLDVEDTKGKELDGTSIRLLGPLYPATLAIPEPAKPRPGTNYLGIERVELLTALRFHSSFCYIDGPMKRIPISEEMGGGFTLARAEFSNLEESETARYSNKIEETPVFVLLVMIGGEDERSGEGLVLARSAESRDEYQRLGFVTLTNYEPHFPRTPMQEVRIS